MILHAEAGCSLDESLKAGMIHAPKWIDLLDCAIKN